jgi:hypothetical protein
MLRHLVFASAVLLLAPVFASGQCLVTLPPNPAFLVPEPYPSSPSRGFWYGTESLWTNLGLSNRSQMPKDKPWREKLAFWSRDFDWHTEPKPDLIVIAKRLDAVAPSVAAERASAAFYPAAPATASTRPPAAMMTMIDIPTAGCWEITAIYRRHSLSFVVSIEP